MKTSTEIFAHNLRTLLEKKHKSQSDLARFLKVTPTTVSRWTNAESPSVIFSVIDQRHKKIAPYR